MRRNLYLTTLPLKQAQELYFSKIEEIIKDDRVELVPVKLALNRITAKPVFALVSSPLYGCAAMDGISVVSKRCDGASESTPLTLKLNEDYQEIDTGDPIIYPYDSVIMAEDLIRVSDNEVRIISSVNPYQHVRAIGEDIVAKEMILPANHQIRAIDLGVMLSGGIAEIAVYKQCKVGIIPSGSEIVDVSSDLKLGDIIESNSIMFKGLVEQLGGIGSTAEIVKDDYHLIKQAVVNSLMVNDMVIINAGSSAGREDYTKEVLADLGEVVVHGVAIKPGKPVILALVNNKPVIGIPGYPVSAYLVFDLFVKPLILQFNHQVVKEQSTVKATITKRVVSSLKFQEFVRVKVGYVANKWIATPLQRGAGAAMSLVKADGFVVIPLNLEGYEQGEEVAVNLYHPIGQLVNTLSIIGSHDLLLDIIADMLPKVISNLYVASSHVGSMAGLMALKNKECILSTAHLLDEKTGVYNISYLKKIFSEPMAIVKSLKRIQGFIVQKGNPLNIQAIEDIKRVRFINRQNGSGTRVLFDYLLKKANIETSEINGYTHEAITHMALAASIKNNTCDVGVGVYSAAMALDLDFIAIGEEDYDIILYQDSLSDSKVQQFLNFLNHPDLISTVRQMGGYKIADKVEVLIVD